MGTWQAEKTFRISDVLRYIILTTAILLPRLAIVLRLRTTRVDASHQWCS